MDGRPESGRPDASPTRKASQEGPTDSEKPYWQPFAATASPLHATTPPPVPAPTPPDNGYGAEPWAAGGAPGRSVPIPAGCDADRALDAIYRANYCSLVRLAALLVHDVGAAEDVVQESFAAMHRAWGRLQDVDTALAYLRQAVVTRSRSAQRRRGGAGRRNGRAMPTAVAAAGRALRDLPPRQREVVVLRYWGDLSEDEVAQATGISPRLVRSQTEQAMSALGVVLSSTDLEA
jgi:DNA-directed RNA polymerase specialized sigma24 family protein